MSAENTKMAVSHAVWSNPWLITLPIVAAILLAAGVATLRTPYAETSTTLLGSGMFITGGIGAVGWLVACAVCWQIAASTRRDQPPS